MTNLKKREWVKTNTSLISVIQRITDIASMCAGLWIICAAAVIPFFYISLLNFLITLVIFQIIGGMTDFYRSWRGVKKSTELLLLLRNWTLSLLLTSWAMSLVHDFTFPLLVWFCWYLLSGAGMMALRLLIRRGVGWLRARGYNTRQVAIAGSLIDGQVLADSFRHQPWLGFNVVGIYDDVCAAKAPEGWSGDLDELVLAARSGQIHNVYIAMPVREEARIRKLIHDLSDTTCSVMLVPDMFAFSVLQSRTDEVNGVTIVPLFETPLSGVNRVVKRAEDIVLSLIILWLCSPVLLAIAAAVRLGSPGPIIFRQTRYGMDGKPINVWKFRTMSVTENGSQVVQATQDDPRINRVGRFLRRTSLDELPQFVNVLSGEMSVVGPRPHAVAHNEQYRTLIEGYMLRHKVKPGITGWAQVNGWRGETDTLEKMRKRVEFDLEYIREWSLWFDIKIVFFTIIKGFVNKTAY